MFTLILEEGCRHCKNRYSSIEFVGKSLRVILPFAFQSSNAFSGLEPVQQRHSDDVINQLT